MNKNKTEEVLHQHHQKIMLNKLETANELSISLATLDRLRKEGVIKSKQIRGQIMFSIFEIARYVET